MRRESLFAVLDAIDGRGYGAYRELIGTREYVEGVVVEPVRIQPDPYAPPSVFRLKARHGFSWARLYSIPLADWTYRRLYENLLKRRSRLGEGRSGYLGIPKPSNAILPRSGVEVKGDHIIARVWVGLPSRHRRVLADKARKLILEAVRALKEAIMGGEASLRRHVEAWIDQEHLRSILPELNAVAFIGENAVLPRRCGGCEDPLPGAKPFKPPPSLAVEIDLPSGRRVKGMLVRKGLTVVTGSAFHGKTTLAEAIAFGIYDHVPGDGREYVVSVRETYVVRAEDGRYVGCVDLSTFIHDLPGKVDVECFTTFDASGATSTAAAVQEAVEAGAKLLVIDEDYVASNMLYTDPVALKLTAKHSVSPIASKASSMKEKDVSLIIVTQGHEPLLAVADTVIAMEEYEPRDVTSYAKKLAHHMVVEEYEPPKPRRLVSCRTGGRLRLRGYNLEVKGKGIIANIYNPQLVEESQYHTILAAVARAQLFEGMSVAEAAARFEKLLSQGFSRLLGREPGPDYAWVRGIDFIHVVSRLPFCKFTH